MKSRLLLSFFLSLFTWVATAQVDIYVPSGPDTVVCDGAPLTMQAINNGYASTAITSIADDIYLPITPIGFSFNFYGTTYTNMTISSNGYVKFPTSSSGSTSPWTVTTGIPSNTAMTNSVAGVYCDLLFPNPFLGGCGSLAYGVAGVAPYRKCVIQFCDVCYFSSACSSGRVSFEIILYETTNIIEIHTSKKTGCTVNAIQGIEGAIGSGTAVPGRNATSWSVTVPDAYRFTPDATLTTYTCTAIPYAPIAATTAPIYWYDGTTYLGSGPSMTVNPMTPTTYTAAAVTCGDTSKDMVNVVIGTGPSITGITPTSPSVCGLCDGALTLEGLVPGSSDTIKYYFGSTMYTYIGVPNAAGQITIPNLCAGTYTNFTVKVGYCTSPPFDHADVEDPAFGISDVTFTNPSVCGACNGTITIKGLIPGYYDTVSYVKDGVPQTPVVRLVAADSTVTLTNLCAGTYNGFSVKMNTCTAISADIITIVDPSFGIADTSHTNASCSACDGSITLTGMTPNQSVTINYTYNGTPQPGVPMTTSSTGQVTLTNMCPGTYTNIRATLNTCISNAVGPIVITAPPLIPISIQSYVQPTECGICNGRIVIKGAPPGPIDTLYYSLNGVPQTPVLYSASPDSIITMYNLCAGTYSNFFIKVGPCPTTTIATPVVLSAPPLVPGFTYAVTPGCLYDVVNFTNTSTSPTGNLWYVWNFGDGNSDTSKNPTHSFTSGTYHVTLTITNHYCVDSTSVDIIVNHFVNAAFTSDTLACQLNPVTFNNGSTGSPAPLSYLWSFGDGVTSTLQNPAHTFTNVGTYTIRLITGNSIPCYDTTYGSVYVDSLSSLAMTLTDTILCRATYVTMNSIFANVGVTGITWDFGNGETIADVNPVVYAYPTVGTFTITSTVGFRICPDLTTTRTIRVMPQPYLALGPDTAICGGSETLMLVDSINVMDPTASWLWNTGETTPAISITTPGNYFATVTVGNCHASDSVLVAEDCFMSMPNIFTPNGDGVNDYFYPRQFLAGGLTAFKMDIYNRWGQLIFSTNTVDGRGWDGKFNGEPQPQEVYVYIIDGTFRDGKKEHHQGNVTLLR